MSIFNLNANQIEKLQKILKAQGLYNGPINGQQNPKLGMAIRRYQTKNGIPVTGVYDTATDQHLADTFRQLGAATTPIKGLDPKTRKFIEENYGYLMAYLRMPEIGPIIIKAAKEGWDEARLTGKLQQTDWFRKQPASVRNWQRDIFENPADVARRRQDQEALIADQINKLGINVGRKRLSQIVEQSLMYGWSQDILLNALVAESKYKGGDMPVGQIGTDMRTINELRRQYLLPDQNKWAYTYAKKIAKGEMTLQDLEALMARKAKTTYGHLSDQLGAGMSMQDLFDAHIQAIAEELELDPDAIDLTNERWASVVSYTPEDQPNRVRAMTVGEARRLARQQPGFRRTDRAREQSASLASTIASRFGRFGG